MIKRILKITDDFLYSKVKFVFEKLEESCRRREVKVKLLKELQNFEFEPLMISGGDGSKFERNLKFRLKMILGVSFVVIPFAVSAFIVNIMGFGYLYAFVFTFVVAILAASRMDEIARRYVQSRWSEVEDQYNEIKKTDATLKIYLAGPDVFKPNAEQVADELKSLCEKYGFVGLFPLDNDIKNDDPKKMAAEIFKSNKKLIDKADIVIANLEPFRGKEPDSGTVWEVGYAKAKGKKVYGYMKDTSEYIDRFTDDEKSKEGAHFVDNRGEVIEDFSLTTNLMVSCSVEFIENSFEKVLKKI